MRLSTVYCIICTGTFKQNNLLCLSTVPSRPRSVTAVGKDFQCMTVGWSAPARSNGGTITNYQVRIKINKIPHHTIVFMYVFISIVT